GAPAPGFRVGAQIQDKEGVRSRNSWGESVTDANGRYAIHGLEAGTWNVFVCLDEDQEKEWCTLPSAGAELSDAAPRGDVDFVLRRGGELVVHALDAATKAPIPDLWVGVQSAARSSSGAAINAIFTDDAGVARIRLPPGRVNPYVSESGGAANWSREGGE